MTANKLDYKDLTSYIISLPKSIIEKIFDHPTTCLAIYRELPELAKLFIMRLLLINQEVPQITLNSWVNLLQQKKSNEAIKTLVNLGIFQEVKTQGGLPAVLIKQTFKDNLFNAIFGDATCTGGLVLADATAQKTTSEFIEKIDGYAVERWESVMKYIVNPRDSKVSNSTKEILKFSGLMKPTDTNDPDSAVLTATAFQFLLWGRRLQIWYFIIQLLEYSQKKGEDITECLMLLFELSFSTFGKAYSFDNFSQSKEFFLQELRTLGLVYMKSRKEKRFYPTRYAISLANGLGEEEDVIKANENGYIVVETNYRIYAYTNSQLQISLIALFAELMYRFPNVVVAVLTRESVRAAFQMGITATQIINFLKTNVHPVLCSKKPVLPVTVTDQISMWYEERNRFKFTEGVFYGQFNSEDDYQMLKNYAQDLNSIIWYSDIKRVMIVKKDAHDTIKKFWKQNKPK